MNNLRHNGADHEPIMEDKSTLEKDGPCPQSEGDDDKGDAK